MHPPATPAPLLDDLRKLPRPFWILFVGTFINRFGTFVWPFLTIYLTKEGHPLDVAAAAVSAFAGGAMGGSLLGGWLADHFGRRNTIVLGTASAAGFFMLLYASSSVPAVIVCAALAGLANGTYHPASSALLADVVPDVLRVRAYAAFRLAANAGFACGACLGGVLATVSTFWLFAGDAITTLLFTVIALLWLPHGLSGQTANAPWHVALAALRKDRTFHILWFGAFAAAVVFSQFGTTYSLHVMGLGLTANVFGWQLKPEAIYGLLFGWNGLMIVLCELPLTSMTLRYDPRRVMALGYALIGAGFCLNAFAHGIFGLWIAMTILTLGEMTSSPTTSAFVATRAPAGLRGRYMGTLGLAWNTAGIVAPQLGFRAFAWDPNSVWFGACALIWCAALVTLRIRQPRATAARPAPEWVGA